ncbi:MAG: prepilin-type N-terminal cleavage/methylation domain-containing protein [Planctomycetota bacterium]|nr:prepilin-type N-terminal cleavage/methylation domain-containing protein [Planctomycetota bacterium]
MSARIHRTKGFTLVEILIVVVILGILAAIVIPQFTNASESAKSSSLVSQLQTIRSQLELYQVQHNGSYPTLAQLWGNMTTKTNSDGSTTGTPTLGPYLQQSPTNALQGVSAVVVSTATPTATTGWLYDASTGSIKAAVPAAKFTALGLSSNDATSY